LEIILNFLGVRIAAINLFTVDLDKPCITYDTVMKRHLRPHCPPFERAEGEMLPSCLHSPAFPCISFYTHSLYSLL